MKISFHTYYFLFSPLVNTFRFRVLLCKIIITTRNEKKDEKINIAKITAGIVVW